MTKKAKIQKKKEKTYNNVSEEELLETIEVIGKKLAYKFKFGYHEIEDMKQQISLFALQGLKNYDSNRPLENFLWTHVRNRLFNHKRDNYQRPDKPCIKCPLFDKLSGNSDSNCTKYRNKLDCEPYRSWHSRNLTKKNLMHLTTIEDLKEYLCSANIYQNNEEVNELIKLLDEELFGEYRSIYLKVRYGSKVCKQQMNKLVGKIQEMLKND